VSPQDVFLLAFRRDLQRVGAYAPDLCERMLAEDRAGFIDALDGEWREGRLGTFIAMALAAHQAHSLSRKNTERLCNALLVTGRPQRALQVLNDQRYSLAKDPGARLDLARALAGAGRLREALAAAEEAASVKSAPDFARRFLADLREATALGSARDAVSTWPTARALAYRLIAIGAVGEAMQTLHAFLVHGGALDGEQVADFHGALATILSLSDEADTRGLFGALQRLHRYGEEARDLELIKQGLAEDPGEDATDLARRLGSDHRGLRLSGALAWGLAGRRAAATLALERLAARFRNDLVSRNLLARQIGQDVLENHPMVFAPPEGRRKVFDVFPFFNEFEMLDIKLHEMADWVDHFVVVEATRTFTGIEKPLNFQANRHAFSRFESKIIHVVVDDYPACIDRAWGREFHQRDMGVRGLSGRCARDDLVLITDVDEIVARQAIEQLEGPRARLLMERARYFLNYRERLARSEQRGLASVWRAEHLRTCGMSYLRGCNDKKTPAIHDAGWHFTSVSDVPGMLLKFRSTSHQEYASLRQDEVAERLSAIQAGQVEEGWERCDVDERFPAYIRDNQDKLSHLLLHPRA
jgi:beta-1,4-mannosyl-glycoprotein beta-1,4-N-acetylglucosaminyltransferase